MKKVFISYSHDSDAHCSRVLELANKLRNDDVQVIIDQDAPPGGPSKGWPIWSETQVIDADYVLIACTETYSRRYEGNEDLGTGQGSACEARAIRQFIYDLSGENKKFRVILFKENDSQFIPVNLRPYHHFPLHKSGAYEQLLHWLQPAEISNKITQEKQVEWPELTENYDWQIANRKNIYQQFVNILKGKEKKRILLLSGNSSKGKTVLLKELSKYAEKQKIATSFLDFKGCPTLDDLFETLLLDVDESLLPQANNTEGTKRSHKFISDLKQLCTPLLLIFDTYEQASDEAKKWLESQLLHRLKQAPAVVIIIAGEKVPEHEKYSWNELSIDYDLPPIKQVQDWLEFTHNKWGCSKITEHHIEAYTIGTEGNPALVFSLLETLVKQFQAQEGN